MLSHEQLFALHIAVFCGASCNEALSDGGGQRRSDISPVLCIFYIFFVFTLKTVIYHLSRTK